MLHNRDMWRRATRFPQAVGIVAMAILPGCAPPRSWATAAEYPPKLAVSFADIDTKHDSLYFKAVKTGGMVYRLYAPNLIAMRDGSDSKRLVFIVGEAREAADRKALKLGQALTVYAVVRERLDPDWDRSLVPAVPERDLQSMNGKASLEAYTITDSAPAVK